MERIVLLKKYFATYLINQSHSNVPITDPDARFAIEN